MSIATLAFILSLFAWSIFFQPFTFSLYVSLVLSRSPVGNIYRGLVFVSIHPVFVFLVEAFNPFTFKVIIDKYNPVAIYFIVLGSSLYTLSVFPV